jgi:hypothetical protein
MEKLGKPGVGVVTDSFLSDALSSAQDNGMAHIRLSTVPARTYYTARSQEPEMKLVVAKVFDRILDSLTRPLTGEECAADAGVSPKDDAATPSFKYSGANYNAAAEAFNEDFLKRHWADGLAVVPPTREAVKWMLTGTTRAPSEALGAMPSKGGKVTVEKVAINAVMAGAKPEYLPVILTAMEVLTDPKYNAHHLQESAGCVSPLIVVNGPIAAEIGMNSGIGYMGHGWRANNTIGRAVRLCLINLGLQWPAENDMCLLGRQDAFGNTTFAENEQDSPWKPYHVDQGFKPEQSTVTVMNVMHEHRGPGGGVTPATPNESLLALARTLEVVRYPAMWIKSTPEFVVAMDPSFAQQLAAKGFSKEDVKWWLFLQARAPYSSLIPKEQETLREGIASKKIPPYLWLEQPHNGESAGELPRVWRPDDIRIVVVGGSPGYTVVWSYGEASPPEKLGQVTKVIGGAALTKAGR